MISELGRSVSSVLLAVDGFPIEAGTTRAAVNAARLLSRILGCIQTGVRNCAQGEAPMDADGCTRQDSDDVAQSGRASMDTDTALDVLING